MVKLNALPLVLRIKHVIHCPGSIPRCSTRETVSFWWNAHAAPTLALHARFSSIQNARAFCIDEKRPTATDPCRKPTLQAQPLEPRFRDNAFNPIGSRSRLTSEIGEERGR